MHGISMAWFGGGGVVRTGLFYSQIDFWGIRLPALTSQEGVMCGCVVCGFLPFHGTRMKSQQPRAEQWGMIRPGPAPWCVVVLHAMNAPKRRLRRSLWVRETNQKCVTHFFPRLSKKIFYFLAFSLAFLGKVNRSITTGSTTHSCSHAFGWLVLSYAENGYPRTRATGFGRNRVIWHAHTHARTFLTAKASNPKSIVTATTCQPLCHCHCHSWSEIL